MNSEQVILDGMTPLQMQVKYEDLIADLERRDLKRAIFSTSQNRTITYYFGSEHARDEAVSRWRKYGIEIIGHKEKDSMSLHEAICESADYIAMRIKVLQKEDQEMTERYDRLPEHVIKRQREISLEVNRLQVIHKTLIEHINQKVENEQPKKETA